MSLDPGPLNRRFRFDRLSTVPDSNGNVQDPLTGALNRQWVPVATVWGRYDPLSVRDYRAGGGDQNEITGRITVRYNGLLLDAANMRAVHLVNGVDTTSFAIDGPLPDNETGYEHLSFPARAGVTDE